MQLTLLKSKLHRATVTGADLNYEGSIALGPDLRRAAGLLLHERVEIYVSVRFRRVPSPIFASVGRRFNRRAAER